MFFSLAKISQARQSSQSPRELLQQLLGKDPETFFGEENIKDDDLWLILYRIATSTANRYFPPKKDPITDLPEALKLIEKASKIVILLGAGGSSGPDFRSKGGLYDTIAHTGALQDPTDVFDLQLFREDPSIFWRFAYTVFPSKTPVYSRTHYFIEELQQKGKLLRVYSQNIDTLERGVPDDKLRCVHGSWRTCHCLQCSAHISLEYLRPFVEKQEIPVCPECGGSIEPGIVFFGQKTNYDELEAYTDAQEADLLLVIGTSLRVAPISELPQIMRNVPSLLINRMPVRTEFNAHFLGDCDDIISMIEYELGWKTEGIHAEEVHFFPDRSFVIPSDNENGTRIVETTKSEFLVCAHPLNVEDLE